MKGKKLAGHILCKITSEDMNMRGYQYRIGINLDINPLARKGNYKEGLHFCFIEDVGSYFKYGTKLALVSVPDDEDVYVEDGEFRTHILRVNEVMSLDEVSTWEYLLKHGADIKGSDNHAIKFASQNGNLKVVEYLYKNGANIMSERSYALRSAAENGHMEVVKYLHENGADIRAVHDHAIKTAARKGDLEMVRYLYENSAYDEEEYRSVLEAAVGRTDIEKYLSAISLRGRSVIFNGQIRVSCKKKKYIFLHHLYYNKVKRTSCHINPNAILISIKQPA